MTLKEQLLKELQNNRDTDLSGESLAARFHVSRNAVWKAMNTLKKEGYTIYSRTNCGYRLDEPCDFIDIDSIRSFWPENEETLPIYYFKEIDSTNTEARRQLLDHPIWEALFLADCQTAGRGRHGHDFYSPAHTGIYMSYVFRPTGLISDAVHITTMASVAILRTVRKLYGLEAQIKWVNDIYLHDRKVCGILTEAITDMETNKGTIILGIGLNLTTKDYPTDIATRAGSLLDLEQIKAINRNQLIAQLVSEIKSMVSDLSDRTYLTEYREHSMLNGATISYVKDKQPQVATVIGIDDDAGLIVCLPNGSSTVLRNGEVSLIRKMPPEASSYQE